LHNTPPLVCLNYKFIFNLNFNIMKKKIYSIFASVALCGGLFIGSFGVTEAVSCEANGTAIQRGSITMYGYDCSDGSTRYISIYVE